MDEEMELDEDSIMEMVEAMLNADPAEDEDDTLEGSRRRRRSVWRKRVKKMTVTFTKNSPMVSSMQL
jgi:hypothetical protein